MIPLKLRPTGLGSGIDKDRPDYTVYTGEWEVGRIYETRGGAVSEELARLEGLGQVGRVALASLSPLAALPNSRRRLSATLACLPLASHRARALRPADFCGLRNRTPGVFPCPRLQLRSGVLHEKRLSFNPARAPPMLFGLFAGPFCGASLQRNRP